MKNKFLKLFKKYARRYINIISAVFIDGFFTLLPFCLTIGIVSFCFKLIKSFLSPLQSLTIPGLHFIPHSEILITLILILLAGVFLKSFVLQTLLHIFDTVISKIPLINPIFLGLKQLVQAFSPSDNPTFKKVVLVEFPRPGLYSIGFLTNEISPHISPDTQHTYYSVFIPMTPNPTGGFFIILKQTEITEINLNTQEAMALIISGGIIQPERLKK